MQDLWAHAFFVWGVFGDFARDEIVVVYFE